MTSPLENLRAALARAPGSTTAAGRPTGAVPAPLPPVREDPSITAGYAIHQQLTTDMHATRVDFNQTELARTERVLRLWKTATAQLAELYADLQQRRRARVDWIEQQLPIGPGVTADTTPADRAVLISAFNTALAAARAATPTQRGDMLAEAERFGDDVTKRAVLTALVDDSQWTIVDQWADAHSPETGALIKEWMGLQEALSGRGFDQAWVRQALHQPERPQEYHQLPQLVNAHNARVRQHNRSLAPGQPAQPLVELDSSLR